MIIELLLKFLFSIVETLIDLIPTITLPESFVNGLSDCAYLISVMSYFLPLKTIALCLSVIFILQNAKFFVSIFNFIVRKIPGIS